MKINPNSTECTHFRGTILGASGDAEAALVHHQRTMALDPLFPEGHYEAMIEAECAFLTEQTGTEIVAYPFENLLIDCARDVGAQIIVRGLRAVADFEYEFQMVGMNRALDNSIETVFLMAEARHQAIASKLVKEIARLDGDVSKFVTPRVNDALRERLG